MSLKLNKDEILEIMPHRDPLSLIDRIEELEPGKGCIGYFYVNPKMEIFKGHFPDNPMFPGIYTMECMNQIGAVAVQTMEKYKNRKPIFLGVNYAKFMKPVYPGDTIKVIAAVTNIREDKDIITKKAQAFVNDVLVAEEETVTAMR